ncbi:MAG TPA: Chromate resistance protein ChrB [Gaiellaceae bacterium]
MTDRSERAWLLVVVSTGGSSTLRVYAWRRLRSLGALYLQNSVCLLPQRAETERAVARLASRLRSEGGSCRSMTIAMTDANEEQDIVAAFSAERSDEYAEICSRTPAFLEEISLERGRGRATYTEMEESEADLERLRKWLSRVRARDYFDADGRAEAEAAVAGCAEALAQFEAEALAAEQPESEPEGKAEGGRRLRAVDS